jgi:hypothetical protein
MDWIKKLPSKGKQRFVSYENLVFTNRKPIDVAVDTVKRIATQYPAPYTLFASGGVDSQACIYAWLQSGIDFEVAFVKYENDFNMHDFVQLELMQQQYGFNIKILEFNVIDFLTTKLKDYVTKYRTISPMLCTHFAMSEMITDGTVVFSGNYSPSYPQFVDYPTESWMSYVEVTNRKMIPCFFLSDPELASSFYNIHDNEYSNIEERFPDQSRNINGQANWEYKVKCAIYEEAGFPVIPQLYKATGFEKIKDYCDEHFPVNRKEKLQYSNIPGSKRSFEIKFRYPWIKLVPEYLTPIKIINYRTTSS